MERMKRVSRLLLLVFPLWSIVYLFLYVKGTELSAPFGTVLRFPLFLFFSQWNVGFVLTAVVCAAALIFCVLCGFSRFSGKWGMVLLPALLLVIDLVGQSFCVAAVFSVEKELLGSYYYFNKVTPPGAVLYYIGIALDVLLLLCLFFPFVRRRKKRAIAPAPLPQEGITMDAFDASFVEREVEKENKENERDI